MRDIIDGQVIISQRRPYQVRPGIVQGECIFYRFRGPGASFTKFLQFRKT